MAKPSVARARRPRLMPAAHRAPPLRSRGRRPPGAALGIEPALVSTRPSALPFAAFRSALGPDVGMAYRRAMNLEEAALATYRLLLLGNRALRFPPEHLDSLDHG